MSIQLIDKLTSKKEALSQLQGVGEKLKEDCSEDVRQHIDTQLEALVREFQVLDENVVLLKVRYEKIAQIFAKLSALNGKLAAWLNFNAQLVESQWISAEAIEKIQRELPAVEEAMVEGESLVDELISVQKTGMEELRREDLNIVVAFDGLCKQLSGLKFNLGAFNNWISSSRVAEKVDEEVKEISQVLYFLAFYLSLENLIYFVIK